VAVTASCPSCGAPVVFKSAASIFAVCEYCQSTLVRHDQALEDIGKMAALVEDRSPLQLGAEGSYKGVHFALIGRIQIKYSQGIWNEWHLMFDDMRTGWLSEAGGEYVLTFAQYVQERLPKFEELKIGQRFVLASQAWTVSNIEKPNASPVRANCRSRSVPVIRLLRSIEQWQIRDRVSPRSITRKRRRCFRRRAVAFDR
jgi:hypothetical protein